MIIGIDASRAFIKKRTGIEEYSYRVIKNLRNKLMNHQVILYLRKNQEVDFEIPKNWKIKKIYFSRFWTQLGLSLELFINKIDILFIPAHIVPVFHPQKTIVVIHGLEYEFYPKAYSLWERIYMRWSIKFSCKWARKIIAVSQNTKKDLINLYKIPAEKIDVIYEGYSDNEIYNLEPEKQKNIQSEIQKYNPYVLFIGRIEERKNIVGIINAFEILKEKFKIPHNLILAGRPGYEYEKIKLKIKNSVFKKNIIEAGYISDEEKWELLKSADVFLFPTFYEGFGIPILEAQSVGVPVIASNNSSIPEVIGNRDTLVDCKNIKEISELAHRLISDNIFRNDIIEKGYKNVKRFDWDKCSGEISNLLLNQDF